ncbi:MAG: glucuronate isomerase [Candidatus Ratteibacteria bacterium]|jgi:glucuronate isomerase
MNKFINDNFLLQTKAAQTLFHEYAKNMPIFDYHCHLPVKQIAENKKFKNLSEIWLGGDHYKWRVMRSNGVDEQYCTGSTGDYEKFLAWAKTVPYTIRNQVYIWTHLELKRYFGITDPLNPSTAKKIYDQCTEMLQSESFRTRSLLEMMNVKIVSISADPADNLEYYRKISSDKKFKIKVLPSFRPDNAMALENLPAFNKWLDKLQNVSKTDIKNYHVFLKVLYGRHDFFHINGCRISDHGIDTAYAQDYTPAEIERIFNKARKNLPLNSREILKYKSALMLEFARMDHEKGWAKELHIGALRDNNTRMFKKLGPAAGFDSIGDFEIARPLARFLDKLDASDQLPKTIIYNSNPRDNELMATMIGNFQDGSIPGKIQFGSGWWFLDQKDGMTKQMEALSSLGLLSRFVGMVTDSRSFLSFPRHEYFRRILCNLIGNDIEHGLLPDATEEIGAMVQDVCFNNAVKYFGINI